MERDMFWKQNRAVGLHYGCGALGIRKAGSGGAILSDWKISGEETSRRLARDCTSTEETMRQPSDRLYTSFLFFFEQRLYTSFVQQYRSIDLVHDRQLPGGLGPSFYFLSFITLMQKYTGLLPGPGPLLPKGPGRAPRRPALWAGPEVRNG